MRKFAPLFTVLAVLLLALAPVAAQDEEPGTIVDIVVASTEAEEAEFTALLAAVQAADPAVAEALSDPEAEFTVFAPTDEAFAALLEALEFDSLEALVEEIGVEELTNILLYHVVEGAVFAETVVTLDGEYVPTLLEDDSVLVSLGEDEEGNATVMVDNATVVTTDIEAANGVIHVIDTVLVPDGESGMDDMGEMEATEEAMGDDMMMEDTIVDIVVASTEAEEAEFTALLAAVQAADPAVAEALSDPEAELTVFAPTDEAFAALLEALEFDSLEALVEEIGVEELTNILLYHVVEGAVFAETVVTLDGEYVPTLLEDDSVLVSLGEDEEGNATVMVDNATVVTTDIEAANGVIHVIDTVLMPDGESGMDDMGEMEATEEAMGDEE